MPAVLVDKGPLLALLDRSGLYYLSCQDSLSSLDDALVTVMAGIDGGHVSLESLLAGADSSEK